MPEKTEKEKMLAGERYICFDSGLESERQIIKALLLEYNQSTAELERQATIRKLLGEIGEGSQIESPFHCVYGKNIFIGNHVFINVHCAILDCNKVHIGHHVMIGPYVQIYTPAHDLQAATRIQGWEVAKPIYIEENVWIGGGAIILPGVKVGRNAVVGAGAVVTRDVPANTVVAGNPAQVIREIEQK